ncbi:MAG: hypothetical protein P4M12_04955 [Gammaproteobacteria bacterium]|nr:hypothetical protein [Gammaproteobacteria bacterium]
MKSKNERYAPHNIIQLLEKKEKVRAFWEDYEAREKLEIAKQQSNDKPTVPPSEPIQPEAATPNLVTTCLHK